MKNDGKLGAARTVKGRILIMSVIMTLATVINVIISIVIQYNQTMANIKQDVEDNLKNSAGTVKTGVNNLTILVNDHAYDYEFIAGTAEQKEEHIKNIMSFDKTMLSLVFMDADGVCYGGEIPEAVKSKLNSASSVITTPDSITGSFYIAVKTSMGTVLCSNTKTEKLNSILSQSSADAFLLSPEGKVVSASGAEASGDYSKYVCKEENQTVIDPIQDGGYCYGAGKLEVGENWTLLVRKSSNGYFSGLNSTIRLSIGTLLIMIGLCFSSNYYFKKTVTEPLEKACKKLVDMSNGVLSGEPVNHSSDDDMGQLSAAVNKMAGYNNTIINDIRHTAEEIAANNLCVKPNGEYTGDFIPLKEALEKIVESIRTVVANVEEAGRQVSSGSEEMSRNSAVLSTAAEEQSATVSQLNENLNAVYNEINSNAQACGQASGTAKECLELVNEGNAKMGDMLEAMNEINGTSSKIANIIKTIQDISEQTNILSINASIEAARVGAAGKGFAVVAGEVGKLAEKTAQAAKTTTGLIQSSIDSVKHGTVIANETAETLGKIVEKTDATSRVVGDIAEASTKQAESVKEVLVGMNSISAAVNQVSDSARECADSSEELAGQAELLHSTIDKFTISESKPKYAPAKPAPAAKKPASINLDDNAEKKPNPSVKAPAKPASAAKKPASISLDDNAEKKPQPSVKAPAKPAPAAKKPASINLDDNAEKKPQPSVKHAAIKTNEAAPAVKSGGEPVTKATMQPVKRTITLDNNKY